MTPTTDTGTPLTSTKEVAEYAAEKAAKKVIQQTLPSDEREAKDTLFHIILSIAGVLVLLVLSIFGWVAVHVMNQQDILSAQVAEQARHTAAVEAKLDILLTDRHVK